MKYQGTPRSLTEACEMGPNHVAEFIKSKMAIITLSGSDEAGQAVKALMGLLGISKDTAQPLAEVISISERKKVA